MDCLYRAWADYLYWMTSYDPDPVDYALYRTLKVATHGRQNQFTSGSVVPWMLNNLGRRYGFKVRGVWRVCSPQVLIRHAPSRLARLIARRTDFGEEVETIILAPAIYLDLSSQHALFQTTVPKNRRIVGAYVYVARV